MGDLEGSRNDRAVSFWHDTVPGSLDPRPALQGDREADVAVVGAGFTGLWAAYHLLRIDPGLRVVVVERERRQSARCVAFTMPSTTSAG